MGEVEQGLVISLRRIKNINQVKELKDLNCRIFIDIPIGLVSAPMKYRECDHEARRRLSPRRHSSVFPAPARKTLEATSYRNACEINKAETGKMLSIQSYNLIGKIKEVDHLLSEKIYRNIIYECHPEIAFLCLSGNVMRNSKKTAAGLHERSEILSHFIKDFSSSKALKYKQDLRVAADDILDALALAVFSSRSGKKPGTLPVNPPFDKKRLPMQIVFSDNQITIF